MENGFKLKPGHDVSTCSSLVHHIPYCRTLPFSLFIIIYSVHQPGRHVFVKKKKKKNCTELLFPVSRNQQTNQINPISYWSNSLRLPVCEGRHQLQLNAPWRVAARHHCVTKLLSRTIAVESEDIFPTERSLLCRSFTRFFNAWNGISFFFFVFRFCLRLLKPTRGFLLLRQLKGI